MLGISPNPGGSRYLDIEDTNVPFTRDDRGRPQLPGTGMECLISHSNDLVAVKWSTSVHALSDWGRTWQPPCICWPSGAGVSGQCGRGFRRRPDLRHHAHTGTAEDSLRPAHRHIRRWGDHGTLMIQEFPAHHAQERNARCSSRFRSKAKKHHRRSTMLVRAVRLADSPQGLTSRVRSAVCAPHRAAPCPAWRWAVRQGQRTYAAPCRRSATVSPRRAAPRCRQRNRR